MACTVMNFTSEAVKRVLERVSRPDPPGRAPSNLLTGDQVAVQPTMQGRGRNVQHDLAAAIVMTSPSASSGLDWKQVGCASGPQIHDPYQFETAAASGRLALLIENVAMTVSRVKRMSVLAYQVQRLIGS